MNITREALGEGRFFVCFLLAMFLALGNNLLSYNPCSASNSIATECSDNITEVYVNWILEHSTKISRQMAINIYEVAMSMENGLLYVALMYRESNFDPTAKSRKGAIGITQIMPGIWTKTLIEQGIIKERRDLFDYDKSILASKYILTEYYKKTSSWEKALRKYVGEKHKTYAKDVLAVYGELQLLKQEGNKK
jgi:soluble lytic murein transglycosylase-like protein